MSTDLITISSSVLPEGTRVAGFRGSEASRSRTRSRSSSSGDGRRRSTSRTPSAPRRALIDRPPTRQSRRSFHGILAHVELLHEFEGHSLLRAVLVPRLWQLGLSKHSRIFTKMTRPRRSSRRSSRRTARRRRLRAPARQLRRRRSTSASTARATSTSLAVDGARGHLLLLRARRGGEKLVLSDDSAYDERPARRAGPLLPAARRGRQRGRVVPLVHVPRTPRCPASEAQGLRLREAEPRRLRRGAGVATTARARSSLYGERFFTPDGRASASPAPRRGAPRARRSSTTRTGTRVPPPPGLHLRARGPPARARSTRDTSPIEVAHSGNQAAGHAELPRAHRASTHDERLSRRGHGHPGEDAVPRRARDAVAAHLRLRERHRRRRRPTANTRRSTTRAATRSSSSSTRATSRTARVDVRAHDAAARRRHRGLPLPAAQGHRGGVHLPRRRPRPAGHRGRGARTRSRRARSRAATTRRTSSRPAAATASSSRIKRGSSASRSRRPTRTPTSAWARRTKATSSSSRPTRTRSSTPGELRPARRADRRQRHVGRDHSRTTGSRTCRRAASRSAS